MTGPTGGSPNLTNPTPPCNVNPVSPTRNGDPMTDKPSRYQTWLTDWEARERANSQARAAAPQGSDRWWTLTWQNVELHREWKAHL
jgi:hypothetical protein